MEHLPALPPKGRIWFTSDWHLGHRRILEYCKRPYDSIEEHDSAILQAVRETVGPDDVLYVLGDIAMSSLRKYKAEIAELPGTLYLVCGNHDPAWHGFKGMNQKSRDPKRYSDAGFTEVNIGTPGKDWILSYEALGWPGIGQVALCHFPKEPEDTELGAVGASAGVGTIRDRFEVYRPQYELPIICGHVHDAWKTKATNLNVGVDVWGYKPVSAAELLPLVRKMGVENQWPNQHY